MSKDPFNFSLESVMEVRFRQSFRGYNQDDVEEFIDSVAQDYAAYNREIERLNLEIDELKKGYGYK
ncbi:DivIVA domain-containing protein [Oceanobacillus sp. CAU 1775]